MAAIHIPESDPCPMKFGALGASSGVCLHEFSGQSLMANRYSLKTRLAGGVLPGNVQHIGTDFAIYDCESRHLIMLIPGRLSVNPGSVSDYRRLLRRQRLDGIEFDMSFAGNALRRLLF